MLFKNTNKITADCLHLFEKIGVMDFQGVGSLIKNNEKPGFEELLVGRDGSNSIGMNLIGSPTTSADQFE